MFKIWESTRAINLAAGNVHFISYITDGYYSYRTEYKASLQRCGCIQGWEWPKKKNTENNILVPRHLLQTPKAFVWAGGGLFGRGVWGPSPKKILKNRCSVVHSGAICALSWVILVEMNVFLPTPPPQKNSSDLHCSQKRPWRPQKNTRKIADPR